MKVIVTALLILFSINVFSQKNEIDSVYNKKQLRDTIIVIGNSQTDTSQVFVGQVTTLAQPVGGMDKFTNFVSKNISKDVIIYVNNNKIKGKVSIKITIGRDGIIQDATVIKKLDPVVDEEVVRVVKLTQWTPAYFHEHPVKTMYLIPFNF